MIEHHTFKQMEVSAFQEAKAGQPCCGDSYFMTETDDYFVCVLADGLGSGTEAKRASEQAVSVVKASHEDDVDQLMKACNRALASCRGAVLSIFKILFHSHELIFSGVGNVRFLFYPPNGKMMYPLPTTGFLSGKPRNLHRVQIYPFEPGSAFMMYSDGWEMNATDRAVISKMSSPAEVSRRVQSLFNKHQNKNDDVTMIFGKNVVTTG